MSDMGKNIESLERDRKAAANNTAAIVQQIGAMPDGATLTAVRLGVVVDMLWGPFEMDEDGGYVSGSRDRMEFETKGAVALQGVMEAIRERVIEQQNAPKLMVPESAVGGSGIVLPGSMGS